MQFTKEIIHQAVSLCIPDYDILLSYNKILAKFTGAAASFVNPMADRLNRYLNLTVINLKEPTKIIKHETGQYSGCYGMLQRGEAD